MSDLLNKFKDRQRPRVEARDASLLNETEVTSINPSLAVVTSQDPPPKTKDIQSINTRTSKDLAKRVERLPEVGDRRQIRLEKGIDSELELLCSQQPKGMRFTIETYLEAAYLYCLTNQEAQKCIHEVAARRYDARKEAGKLRRLHSQLVGNFSNKEN
jgi:hypothetical protein